MPHATYIPLRQSYSKDIDETLQNNVSHCSCVFTCPGSESRSGGRLTWTSFLKPVCVLFNETTWFQYTKAVCKVRGLNLLLRVGTLWKCGDGLFFEVPPLASDALLEQRSTLLQTVDHSEISCLGAPFSWLEKPRNRVGRARSGLYGGCSNGVPPIHFSQAEHKIQFIFRSMRFPGFFQI
jgi:hypothetical protein